MALPTGWPVGCFTTREQAQEAVNVLVVEDVVPPEDLTIVGTDLMQVEHVVAKLTWLRMIMQILMVGVLFGLILGLVSVSRQSMLTGVAMGIIFGIFLTVPQTFRKKRYLATQELVPRRFDVLCNPAHAVAARDRLTQWVRTQQN